VVRVAFPVALAVFFAGAFLVDATADFRDVPLDLALATTGVRSPG
jgi:hypothetical protein